MKDSTLPSHSVDSFKLHSDGLAFPVVQRMPNSFQ